MPRPHRLAAAASALVLALSTAWIPPAAAGAGAGGPLAEPDAIGPLPVGRMTFDVVDASRDDRTLTVDAWYPVDPADAGGPRSEYDLVFTGIVSEVAFDAPPVGSQAALPLVVFSHGNNGIRFQSFFLAETLASHGFVVVAPDHAGNTALDLLFPGTPFEARDRPLDISFLITRMLERNADPDDPFYGRIDPSRIGVAGHSFGGFTALAMAAGFDDVPPDPRVRAIVPISPASTIFDEAQLAGIATPTLILGGTADTTTPIDPQSVLPFELIEARPRYRVDLEEAGHNSFTDICAIGAALEGLLPPELLDFLLGNLAEGCAPELIPIDEAHRVSNLYVVSFLSIFVEGDPRYARFLNEGRVRSRELPVEFFVAAGRTGR